VAADREALGLSAVKPSEMVAGLDQAADRAAKLEARESAKKKAGGRVSTNVAVRVDETGRRWAWKVRLGLAGAAVAVIVLIGALVYRANRSVLAPREGNEQARRDLLDLKMTIAPRMKLFAEDETITSEMAKQRLVQTIDDELAVVLAQIKTDTENRRPAGTQTTQRRDWLRKLRDLKDAWGQEFTFKMTDADTVEISATGKTESGSSALTPVMINLRAKKKK